MGITSHIKGASSEVISAIKNASQKTGVDFDYLVNQARTESSFRPDAKAKTSSATGLYQFIDKTWLETVSKHGSKHGLSEQANAIQRDFQGRYFVADDTLKTQIMDMRKDPKIAAIMAAEFASDNQHHLETETGKSATQTDLYLAHFLGPNGASQYIKAMLETPYRPAAYLMPAAARANKNIFYNSDGSPKSLTQIYNDFEAKFGKVTEVQTAESIPSNTSPSYYKRDLSFERMYGNGIDKFVAKLPHVEAIKNTDLFNELFTNPLSQEVQKQRTNQSLFLTLTMLDLPK